MGGGRETTTVQRIGQGAKWLTRSDLARKNRFYLGALQQRDHAVPAIPDAVFCSPHFVGFDFSTAR